MSFWIPALALALVTAALILRALARGARTGSAQHADVGVYRDQLAEVERDLARGVLAEDEAERLRTEVKRRLLEADRAHAGEGTAAAPRQATRIAMAGCAVLVVGGAAGLYLLLGAPGYRDLPIRARIAQAEDLRADRPSQSEAVASMPSSPPREDLDPEFLALMEKLRATMKDRPDDLKGQQLLARNEGAMGNFSAAAEAQQAVIRLKGEDADATDQATLAELMVMAAGGYVSPQAEAAVSRALDLAPEDPRARYYAGLLYAQTGRPDLAFRIWRHLLEEGPEDAPWIPPIRARIDTLAQLAGVRYSAPPPTGPSAEDVASAADMSPEERQQMIRGMVQGLSDRLATQGGAAPDWARLITAYGVLGETDKAGEIYREARQVFAADPEGMKAIRAAADRAGVAQ